MIENAVLTNKLDCLFAQSRIAGMTVAVTDRGKMIYNKSFGCESTMRPHIPTDPDALYKIASITKTVTAIMILRLVERGVLDLDLPIRTYLPQLKLSRPEAVEQMTLRHLLTHTAGMPGDVFLEEGSRDEDTIERNALTLAAEFPLSSLPAEKKFCYSSWGYNLIGCVASAATGRALSDLIAEYVLTPLGTERTTFDYQVASTYPLSLPHVPDDKGNLQVVHYQRINTVYHAGAGLYSNGADLCRVLRLFLNGGRTDTGEVLLSSDSMKEMLSRQIERANDPGSYYGLGVHINPYNGRYIYGHTGNYDPYNSSIFADLEKGYGVVTLFNSPVTDQRHAIPRMIFDMID